MFISNLNMYMVIKGSGSIQSNVLNKHLYLSDIWLGVVIYMDTKKNMCKKHIGLHEQKFVNHFRI